MFHLFKSPSVTDDRRGCIDDKITSMLKHYCHINKRNNSAKFNINPRLQNFQYHQKKQKNVYIINSYIISNILISFNYYSTYKIKFYPSTIIRKEKKCFQSL